jgi:hypothetical protein
MQQGHKEFVVEGTLVFSGNYATGGEALDFNALTKLPTTKPPRIVLIVGKNGYGYEYDHTNKKVKTLAGITETAAGAYPAGITGDEIRFRAYFPKFG